MKLLVRLWRGDVALWRTFWLIGTPLALLWDVTGVCMVFGFGVENLSLTEAIIALFVFATLATPFASVAIWRSASNYPRKTRWHTAFAWGAKLCAAFTGLVAALSVVGLLYLGNDLIQVFLS